ncbi:MAG: hypothetical protein ACYT04_37035 [Nostoc sp.]
MKKTSQLRLTFRDVLPYIHLGQCHYNAFLVGDVYSEVEYVEGCIFNGEKWLQHAWNRLDGDEFDLSYQLHFPHLLYCDRKIEVVGTLENLEGLGYSFAPGFAPLTEQGHRLAVRNRC